MFCQNHQRTNPKKENKIESTARPKCNHFERNEMEKRRLERAILFKFLTYISTVCRVLLLLFFPFFSDKFEILETRTKNRYFRIEHLANGVFARAFAFLCLMLFLPIFAVAVVVLCLLQLRARENQFRCCFPLTFHSSCSFFVCFVCTIPIFGSFIRVLSQRLSVSHLLCVCFCFI